VSDISFEVSGKTNFPTKYDGEVFFLKEKWDRICIEPERYYYRLNGEKVSTTLINPDYVRYNRNYENQVIYYKQFDSYMIAENVTAPIPWVKAMAVVVDVVQKKVCAVYPTDKIKSGKEYKGQLEQ